MFGLHFRFIIDPISGEIKTVVGLDYERDTQHILVVGTNQAENFEQEMSTCTVIINVQDVNDIPPLFTRLPPGNAIHVRRTLLHI